MPQDRPKAFVSYSWSSPEHCDMIESYAKRLVGDGVDLVFDRWGLRPGQDKYAFMEKMVADPSVSHVIIFSDEMYAQKANAHKAGVGTEAQIISPEIYQKADQEKFIPVVCQRREDGEPWLPTFLAGRWWIDFSTAEMASENWEELIRTVYGKPLHEKPSIGKPPSYLVGGEGVFLKQDFEGLNRVLSHCAGTRDKTVEMHELSTEEFHSGKQSEHLRITYRPGHTLYDYWTVASGCNIPLTPGSMIEVSAWVKANAAVDIRVGYTARGTKLDAATRGGEVYRGSGEWQEIRLTAVDEKAAGIKGSEIAKNAGYDGTQTLILSCVVFNFLFASRPHAIDVYVDDVRVYSRLPIELAAIEAEKDEVAKLLATVQGKEFKAEFGEIYRKRAHIKELIASQDPKERLPAQKAGAQLIKRYKELKRELRLSQL